MKDYQADSNGGNGYYYYVSGLDLPCTYESYTVIYKYIK